MDSNDYLDERDFPGYPLDLDDLFTKNQRLQRRICALGRKYDATYKELEKAREALGYYSNPFPFLRFPRRIRDQILTYALEAPISVRSHPIPAIVTSISKYKPPTPGLLVVNRQVYREAKEMLYSWNTFSFSESQHMLDFFEQIGRENKDRIQSISFPVVYIRKQPNVHPDLEIGTEPHNWANALISADLRNVTKMDVQGECPGSYGMVFMDPVMENAIKDVLHRNPGNEAIRKLKLTGYHWNAYKKFPQDWKVTTKQWEELDEGEFVEEDEEPDVDSESP